MHTTRRIPTAIVIRPLSLGALAVATATATCGLAWADGPLNLTGWTLFDPDGNWSASNPTPTSIRLDEQKSSQVVHPGWVVSDFTLAAVSVIEFELSVAAGTGDDDPIGFGFSYLDGAHSYLLDWKRSTQTFNWGQQVVINDDTAEQGLKIKRIDGGYTWDGLWGGTDGMGVSTIAGPTGGPWVAGTTYQFRLELSPGRIVVLRDGRLLFDVTDSGYAGGAGSIALYGFSQDNIILNNVFITPPPTVCPADFTGDGQVNAADLAVLLGAWANAGGDLTGDGTTNAADLSVLLGAWGPCP